MITLVGVGLFLPFVYLQIYTGRVKIGRKQRITRAEQPGPFWFFIALQIFAALVIAAVGIAFEQALYGN